jgi:peptidoglycan hydrolase-like protein with peptidoglycan-binding domain
VSDPTPGAGSRISDGGISGGHSSSGTHEFFIGPATSDEYNTYRFPLVPRGCWRLEDVRFEFDSSFINPSAAEEFKSLASLVRSLPGAPLSVFGHADPVGNDDYNKKLSGRRATAVYGMLIRDTNLWEELYSNPMGGDNWKDKAIPMILQDLGYDAGTPEKNQEGIKKFQADNGLPSTGNADRATRAKMFLAYMDKHCKDESGNPFKVEKKDFLARGENSGGKGDYQGCGEFNPVLMFSEEENKEYSKPENKEKRNAENAPNRRVLIFMFRPGSYVSPGSWPCPRVKEGIAGCQKRLWSDSKTRRAFQEKRREYHKTHDTFACRFYDRLGVSSPCENILLVFETLDLIFQRYPGTDAASGIQGLEYEYTVAGSQPIRGTTGADGRARLRVPPGETANLKVMGAEYQVRALTPMEPFNQTKGMQRRLNMLGYNAGPVTGTLGPSTEYAVLNFQADNAPLRMDGLPAASIQQAIKDKVGE